MNTLEKDLAYVWHPFTQMQTAEDPIVIEKGEGSYLYSKDGKKYLDAISSWWVTTHGHANPYIADKVYEQLKKLEHTIFTGITHDKAADLAARLIGLLPDNQAKIFYSDNGSTSVEVAIKMAFQFWHNQNKPKTKIICFDRAYHGDTFGAMSVGGRTHFTAPFVPFLFDVVHVEVPIKGSENKVVEQMKVALENNDVAAFIYEPLVLGAAGMVMYSPEVLNRLLELCKNANVLCIADEVFVGFGRTGKFFASENMEFQPDIVTMSKGITGGTMALGATACTQEIFDMFLSDEKLKALFHGHSFTGNPVACAAACASLDLFGKDECWSSIAMICEEQQAFVSKMTGAAYVKEIRSTGTILAIEVDTGEGTSYFNTIRDTIYNYFMDQGIIIRPLGNVLYLVPPYCITREELQGIHTHIEAFFENLPGN
ncbi:MAG: adenosylmethionine--8-amino-7-oxononanoate transaminase [Flavobacteriales bacterium]|nr:adenosylmethionine--8-amino-7-oxononanoate transaminase [Flavobacteriales bacterium]